MVLNALSFPETSKVVAPPVRNTSWNAHLEEDFGRTMKRESSRIYMPIVNVQMDVQSVRRDDGCSADFTFLVSTFVPRLNKCVQLCAISRTNLEDHQVAYNYEVEWPNDRKRVISVAFNKKANTIEVSVTDSYRAFWKQDVLVGRLTVELYRIDAPVEFCKMKTYGCWQVSLGDQV